MGNPVPVAVTVLPRVLVLGSSVSVRAEMVRVADAVAPRSSVSVTVSGPAESVAKVTGTHTVAVSEPPLSRLMG